MALLNITIRSRVSGSQKVLVEMDAEKFEKLAADLGLFNPDFVKSIERAEGDYRKGRVSRIKTLRELRG